MAILFFVLFFVGFQKIVDSTGKEPARPRNGWLALTGKEPARPRNGWLALTGKEPARPRNGWLALGRLCQHNIGHNDTCIIARSICQDGMDAFRENF